MRDPPDACAMEKKFQELVTPREQAGRLTNPMDGKQGFIADEHVSPGEGTSVEIWLPVMTKPRKQPLSRPCARSPADAVKR
jgi:hypothetical protein